MAKVSKSGGKQTRISLWVKLSNGNTVATYRSGGTDISKQPDAMSCVFAMFLHQINQTLAIRL